MYQYHCDRARGAHTYDTYIHTYIHTYRPTCTLYRCSLQIMKQLSFSIFLIWFDLILHSILHRRTSCSFWLLSPALQAIRHGTVTCSFWRDSMEVRHLHQRLLPYLEIPTKVSRQWRAASLGSHRSTRLKDYKTTTHSNVYVDTSLTTRMCPETAGIIRVEESSDLIKYRTSFGFRSRLAMFGDGCLSHWVDRYLTFPSECSGWSRFMSWNLTYA